VGLIFCDDTLDNGLPVSFHDLDNYANRTESNSRLRIRIHYGSNSNPNSKTQLDLIVPK
jgi:hypothetical protein